MPKNVVVVLIGGVSLPAAALTITVDDDDIGDELKPNGGRMNMGAYGGTAEASKSPFS